MEKEYLTLLSIAEKDLRSSIILYEHKLYSQSLYLFCQSVEKAYKSYYLAQNKSKNATYLKKKVGHKSNLLGSLMYKEAYPKERTLKIAVLLDKTGFLKEIDELNINYTKYYEDTYMSLDILDELSKKDYYEDIINETNKGFIFEILDIINGLKEFDKFKALLNKKNRNYKTYKEKIEYFIRVIASNNPEYKKLLEDENEFDIFIKGIVSYALFVKLIYTVQIPLQYFSMMTVPYLETIRYDSTKIYNLKRPIIKYLPLLQTQLKKTYRAQNKIYKNVG